MQYTKPLQHVRPTMFACNVGVSAIVLTSSSKAPTCIAIRGPTMHDWGSCCRQGALWSIAPTVSYGRHMLIHQQLADDASAAEQTLRAALQAGLGACLACQRVPAWHEDDHSCSLHAHNAAFLLICSFWCRRHQEGIGCEGAAHVCSCIGQHVTGQAFVDRSLSWAVVYMTAG